MTSLLYVWLKARPVHSSNIITNLPFVMFLRQIRPALMITLPENISWGIKNKNRRCLCSCLRRLWKPASKMTNIWVKRISREFFDCNLHSSETENGDKEEDKTLLLHGTMQLGLSIWDFVRNIIWWLLGTLTQEVNPFRATSTFSVIASSAGLEKVSAKIGKDQFF